MFSVTTCNVALKRRTDTRAIKAADRFRPIHFTDY